MPSIKSIRLKLKQKLHEQDLKIQFQGLTFMPSIKSIRLKLKEELHEQDFADRQTDRPTDRPTDQPTNRQADSSIPPSNFVCGGIIITLY